MTIKEVKKAIETQTHKTILTGNGFNLAIGLNTSYQKIVEAMNIDKSHKAVFQQHRYDVEKVMEAIHQNKCHTACFKYYANEAIKRDFIKALVHIVKEFDNNSSGGGKTQELLDGFDNFFTLNFDTFLYHHLLKNAKATFTTKDYSPIQREFDDFLKNLIKENPTMHIERAEGVGDKDFDTFSQTHQANIIRYHVKNEKFKNGDNLKKGLGDVLKNRIHKQEEVTTDKTPLNDGFNKDLWADSPMHQANLYFLHGALHLYEDDNEKKKQKQLIKTTKKITASQEKKLVEDIEENWDSDQIICLLKATDKKAEIDKSAYLSHCYTQLSSLSGALVVIGVGFNANDLYLLEAINQSNIKTLYIHDYEGKSLDKALIKANLPNKTPLFFTDLQV